MDSQGENAFISSLFTPFLPEKDGHCIKGATTIDAIMTTNDNPKYNYVSCDSNGVVGFVDGISGEEPFPAGAVSLALGGSFLGSCFIQRIPFFLSNMIIAVK